MKNSSLQRQSGLTMISWLVVITIGVFFVLIGIKMIPTYMENYSIKQVLHQLPDDRAMRDVSRRELKRIVLKRFKINSVYNFKPEDLIVTKTKTGIRLSVDYEVRKPVIGNVFVVMSFSDAVDVRR